MDEALGNDWRMAQQDKRISEVINREYAGLRNFIRRRVRDQVDAEDILQDVFYELIEAYRLMKPIEQVTAWLFRVARNRIIDRFRRKKRDESRTAPAPIAEDGARADWIDFPSPEGGPDTAFLRSLLLEELDSALDELPNEQREVFVAHELIGYSFNEIAARTGVGVNTLISRKHYAVLHLRQRLRDIYEQFLKHGS